jgi:16S rRNA (adenine1518-N6/adenine1519-N6)-dimethyltransferase
MKDNAPPKLIFRPNKKLGQNFLFDKNYLRKIVDCCPVDVNTVIIEIGSGYGNLTNFLAKTNCQKVISLEKDQNLFQQLKENGKIVYIHEDALKIN